MIGALAFVAVSALVLGAIKKCSPSRHRQSIRNRKGHFHE